MFTTKMLKTTPICILAIYFIGFLHQVEPIRCPASVIHNKTKRYLSEHGHGDEELRSEWLVKPSTRGAIYFVLFDECNSKTDKEVLDIYKMQYNGLIGSYKYNGKDHQRWYFGYDGVIRSNYNTDWCLTMKEDARQTVAYCNDGDLSDFIFTIEC